MSELPVSVGLASEFRVQVRSTSFKGGRASGGHTCIKAAIAGESRGLPNWFACDVRRKKEKAKAKAGFLTLAKAGQNRSEKRKKAASARNLVG